MYMLQSEILREADAMAMLDHPYIVRLYGACVQYSKSLCIVLHNMLFRNCCDHTHNVGHGDC